MQWDFFKDPPTDAMRIVEDDDCYRIDVTTPNAHYFYSVNKATGKIENEGHGHFIHPDPGPFEPVRDTDELDPEDFDIDMVDE